jgi:hypothetical protein
VPAFFFLLSFYVYMYFVLWKLMRTTVLPLVGLIKK